MVSLVSVSLGLAESLEIESFRFYITYHDLLEEVKLY